MVLFCQIKNGIYYDSITLMNLQKQLTKFQGIDSAAVVMATPVNKAILRNAELWQDSLEKATSDDLVVSIRAESKAIAEEAWEKCLENWKKSKSTTSYEDYRPKTLDTAMKSLPQANIAMISVPGKYAYREAKKCLDIGLHVMLFSDNVALAEEIELKKMALAKNLLVMGPDCGTAIIAGVGLGFANAVRSGNIGIVGASGTGIQEVVSIIHNMGEGISHAIGTGGRDLSQDIGGITMLQGIEALQQDEKTKVIILISKPPHPDIVARILHSTGKSTKPVVIHFLGTKDTANDLSKNSPIFFSRTLFSSARYAIALLHQSSLQDIEILPSISHDALTRIEQHKKLQSMYQKYIRGLYSGGTLAYETLFFLREKGMEIYANIGKKMEYRLSDPSKSYQHSILDLGEDEYTVGRPHPMIDNTFRSQRLLQEGMDPETSVIAMDLVLGYGSQKDPLSTLLPCIQKIQKNAKSEGRDIAFVIYVCGTDQDLQNKQDITTELVRHGIIVPNSNVETSEILFKLFSR